MLHPHVEQTDDTLSLAGDRDCTAGTLHVH